MILEDQTEEILAQEENALLADLLNESPAAITVTDLAGNYLYSNQKNLDLHGYTQKEFLNLNILDIDTPETAALLDRRMEEVKKYGEITFEVVHIRKDCLELTLEVHAKIARWGYRDVILSIATDISERKEAERALRESECRFADIIDFLPDATFVVDSKGVVIAWNHAIEESTGVRAREIVGKGDYEYAVVLVGERRPMLIDLIFRDDPEVRKDYLHLRKDGSAFTAETEVICPGRGEMVLQLKASPLYDRGGNITGAIESIRDVTEWRRLEEAHKSGRLRRSDRKGK
jgi:PAS domain S-box-containing protein